MGGHLPFRNRVATSKQKSLRALTRACLGFNVNAFMRVIYEQEEEIESRR